MVAEAQLVDLNRRFAPREPPDRDDEEQPTPATPAVDGAAFILDAPAEVPAIWGEGDRVAWAAGEPLLICGPAGAGKTTIAQQLTLARLGLADQLLRLPVRPEQRRVLYLASDRPPQARRSFARMVDEGAREVLAEKLVVWPGPLPFDLAAGPERLAAMAAHYGAGTVVIDSLKDVALDLSKDETGSRVNHALQLTLAAGVEVVALHHQRKASAANTKPRGLDDVYGSTWITAGAGSVLLVWGAPGDAIVEVTHLKQPAGDVGPLKVLHDHSTGCSEVYDPLDLLALLRATAGGLTAAQAAGRLYDVSDPDRNQVQRARRRLDELVPQHAHRRDGSKGGKAGGTATTWHPITLLEGAL